MCLWPTTYAMETRGVRVDLEFAEDEIERLADEAAIERRKVDRKAWQGFNIRSTVHLAKLVEQLGITIRKRTKTGKPSVDAVTLSQYMDNDTVRSLLRYRTMTKGISSFFGRYHVLAVQDENTGENIIHPNFNQVGPATGRYSCRDPNLQNAADPNKTRAFETIRARAPFGPREGYTWYCADYAQQEMRYFAHVAQEPFMLEALRDGRDIHTECANKAWGGHDNLGAINAAIDALELDGLSISEPTEELKLTWKDLFLSRKRS